MKVKDLIEILQQFDEDTTVRFSYDYGDHVHHLVAHEVEYIDLQNIKYSSYVDDYVIDDNEEGEFIDDPDKFAVVLS